MIPKSIIITAGGLGKRMGATIPKQFLLLAGRPVLIRTIERFLAYDSTIQIILVLPSNQFDFWKALCVTHNFHADVEVVKGGKERFHSVQNGLKIARGSLVGVHDAVRPLVSIDVIERCFSGAEKYDAVIPVMPVIESIREVGQVDSRALNRNQFRLVQTPQCFKKEVLMSAYASKFNESFTDDASVVESIGFPICLVEGNQENIKITSPLDLKMAHVFLENE